MWTKRNIYQEIERVENNQDDSTHKEYLVALYDIENLLQLLLATYKDGKFWFDGHTESAKYTEAPFHRNSHEIIESKVLARTEIDHAEDV